MKTQHIVVTVLVLSVCQWSVLGQSPAAPIAVEPSASDKQPPTTPPTLPVIPTGDNTTTTSTTTPAPAPGPSPNTTTTTTTTTTTHAPDNTTTTLKPTTPTPPTTTSAPTTTTAKPTPTPAPSGRHFDAPSFIGGIVLTIGLIAIGIVGHKIYKAKFDRNYHTL